MPLQNRFSSTSRALSVGVKVMLWTLASSLGAVALGQDASPEGDQETATEDLPERVARLSYTQGGVSLQPVGETEWSAAEVNRPIVPGDYVRTDPAGRAELQMDQATVRLGSDSNLTVLALDDRAFRLRVTSGVVNVRVRELGETDVIEVETPQATASILRPGNYRLEVGPAGDTTVVKVSSGMLEARGADQSFVVRPQQVATLTGTNHLSYRTAMLGAPDSFDEWTLQRDQQADRALSTESSKYVSRDTVGYEDLDAYGTWREEPDYGYVWAPTRVVAGWSPYTYGRYSYVSGWGWTWIDDAPWGFAPFHYGSWATIGGRWCWVPGPRHGRPIGDRPIGGPSDRWHVPTPPRRGIVTRNTQPGGFDGASRSFRERDDRDGPRGGDGAGSSRFRTRPDNSGYRYSRPGVMPNDNGQSGIPPVTGQPGQDRRMYIPRNEMPRNTYERNQSRVYGRAPTAPSQPRTEQPRRELSRPEMSRPAPQSQPQQPSSRADNPRVSPPGRGDSGRGFRSHNSRER